MVCENKGWIAMSAIQIPCQFTCSSRATPTIDLELIIYRTSDPSTSLQWWPAHRKLIRFTNLVHVSTLKTHVMKLRSPEMCFSSIVNCC